MTLTQVFNRRASGNDVIENRRLFLIVLSSSQSCTVKAKLRLRLLDEASVISIREKGGVPSPPDQIPACASAGDAAV